MTGVVVVLSMLATAASRDRVTRSPRAAAIGVATLSGLTCHRLDRAATEEIIIIITIITTIIIIIIIPITATMTRPSRKEAREAVMTLLAASTRPRPTSALSRSPAQAISMASMEASPPTTIPCTWITKHLFNIILVVSFNVHLNESQVGTAHVKDLVPCVQIPQVSMCGQSEMCNVGQVTSCCTAHLEARVISRLPLSPMSAGTMMKSSGRRLNTGQYCTASSTSPAPTMPRPAHRYGGVTWTVD